jgi:uncharacterized membrane protein
MNYSNEIIIDLPRKRVIELFDNPENMPKWQKGLKSFKHLSGEPGKVRAKSQLVYNMGRGEIEMIETITVNNLPDEFSATYEAKGVWNEMKNYFYEVNENQTKWVSNSEFKFSGFMMKVMGFLMPGSFKKQSMQFMIAFKEFVENEE